MERKINTDMYISRHNIGNLYEARLIREMDERIVDYLNDHVEDLPFANIFGDDLRIYVPIHKDPTAKEILDTLKRIKDYGGLDVEKGEIVRKIKLDPKYGGGEKEQRMNIGSAISKLKISPEDKKKYLDWLARYKDNMVESLGEQKYGIIISRAPIDVLRMSDFDGMSSCHSQPGKFGQQGQFFQCAIQEAINGGGVAFVVNNREFSDILDQGYGLNDEEFFSDSDRDISDDFSPVSRLRIRRLMDEQGKEFAIPDTRVYGDQKIPGFYDTLRNFLKEKQPTNIIAFKQHKWEKRGGTYYDGGSSINDLVKSYFGGMEQNDISLGIEHNRSDRSAESHRTQEVKELTQNVEAECEEITERYNNRMTYTTVGCDVSFDEDAYIMPYGEVTIDTSDWGVDLSHINFALDRNRDDMQKAIQGNYDDEITWSSLLDWIQNQSGLELDSFEFYNGTIKFAYYSEEVFFSSDEYDSFCDKVEDYDRQMYREFQKPNDWLETFEEVGIISNGDSVNNLKYLIDNGSEDLTYNDDRGDRYVEWNLAMDSISNERGFKISPSDFDLDRLNIADMFAGMLNNYIKTYYKLPVSTSQQQTFKDFMESYKPILTGDHIFYKYGIENIYVDVLLDTNRSLRTPAQHIQLTLKLEVDNFTPDNVGLILFLDGHLSDVRNMGRLAYMKKARMVDLQDPQKAFTYNKLNNVYGRFI